MEAKKKLTFSQCSLYMNCPRAWSHRYRDCLVKLDREETSLRVGSNWHKLLELWLNGKDAMAQLEKDYADRNMDQSGDMVQEFARLRGMFLAYSARYSRKEYSAIETEKPIKAEIYNPDTGSVSRTFEFHGVADGLALRQDGSWALLEHKTSSKIDAAYIRRVSTFDFQVALYFAALNQTGIPLTGVIYDAIQKPTIKLTKKENEETYSARVAQWYQDNPDAIFRQEITLSPDDLLQAQRLLWSVTQKILLDSRLGFFAQNPGNCEKWGSFCHYFELCSSKNNPAVRESLYEVREANPELKVIQPAPAF